jgi:hypothetical protein
VRAREEGEGGYGGWAFPPVLTLLLRLHLAKHLCPPPPPSKCKLTADKVCGASPALRASVFIRLEFPLLAEQDIAPHAWTKGQEVKSG